MEKSIVEIIFDAIKKGNFELSDLQFPDSWQAEEVTSVYTNSDVAVYSFVQDGYEINIYTNGFAIYSFTKKINFWAELNSNIRCIEYKFIKFNS